MILKEGLIITENELIKNGFSLMEDSKRIFHNNLAIVLKEKNISAYSLSKHTGIPRETIRKIVYKEEDPKMTTCLKISFSLNCSVEQIFPMETTWIELSQYHGKALYWDPKSEAVVSHSAKKSYNRLFRIVKEITPHKMKSA